MLFFVTKRRKYVSITAYLTLIFPMSQSILIVIPARYASTRLPGKPLVKIAGVEMIKRVADIAASICRKNENCSYVVATDDQRILGKLPQI